MIGVIGILVVWIVYLLARVSTLKAEQRKCDGNWDSPGVPGWEKWYSDNRKVDNDEQP